MLVSPYLPPELYDEINCAKTSSARTGSGGSFDFPEGHLLLRPIYNILYDVFYIDPAIHKVLIRS
jgi:hypothetical protein